MELSFAEKVYMLKLMAFASVVFLAGMLMMYIKQFVFGLLSIVLIGFAALLLSKQARLGDDD